MRIILLGVVLVAACFSQVTALLAVRSSSAANVESDIKLAAEVKNSLFNTIVNDRLSIDRLLARDVPYMYQPVIAESSQSQYSPPDDEQKERTRGFGGPVVEGIVALVGFSLFGVCGFTYYRLKNRNTKSKLSEEDDDDDMPPPVGPGGTLLEVWSKQKPMTHAQRLTNLFDQLDEIEQSDDSPPGFINKEDLNKAMLMPELQEELERMGLYKKDAAALFDQLSREGLVDQKQFVELLAKKTKR